MESYFDYVPTDSELPPEIRDPVAGNENEVDNDDLDYGDDDVIDDDDDVMDLEEDVG